MKIIIEKFEDYSIKQDIDKYKKFAYDYVIDNHAGFNSLEDGIDELDFFFDSEIIPLLKNKVNLYRVLELESLDDIDYDNFGNHFLHPSNLNRIYDSGFYYSIGISYTGDDDLYLFKVEVNYDMIDFYETIRNKVNYPREFEVTLKDNQNPKIINKKKINKSKIK